MPKKQSYSKDELEKALEAIKDGSSVKSIAKKFGIPRATLHFRLSGKFVKSSFGPRPILSQEDETTLVGWIEHCFNKGFPKRKGDILQLVKQFITVNDLKTPFKDNCPGDSWYRAFLRRHPSIAEKSTSEAVTRASACISEGDVGEWFKRAEEEEELSQVLRQPEIIFNADEEEFLLNPNLKIEVLSKKGSKNSTEQEKQVKHKESSIDQKGTNKKKSSTDDRNSITTKIKSELTMKKKKIKRLQDNNRYLRKKITSLQGNINYLQLSTDKVNSNLKAELGDFEKESLKSSMKMNLNQEDPPSNEIGLAECRTCLQALDANSVLVDLFQCWVPPWDGMESTIAEDLAKLANVQITQTDRYSKVICEPCCLKLQSACDFACSVRKNDRLLRQRYPPLPEEMGFCNETVWPKPIQLDKNINGIVYENTLDVEIKQEVVSEDEYSNNIGMEDSREELATLEIKIEPEELIQPVQAVPVDDENVLSKELQAYTLNGHVFHDTKEKIEGMTNGIDNKEEFPIIKEEPLSDDDEGESIPTDLSLECMLCCKEFNSVTGLKAHVIAQHSYKSVRRKNANNSPEKRQRNREFVCGTCQRRFLTSTDLMVHETCHNKSICYACSAKFDSFEQLTRHSRRCKAIVNKELLKPRTLEDVKRPVAQESFNTNDKQSNKMLKCLTCDEEFTDKYYLTIHEEIYHSNYEQMSNDDPVSDNTMETDNLNSVFDNDN